MIEKIQQTLRDSKRERWIALVILSFTMFAGYLFTEIISPLKPIIEKTYGWDSADYGTVTSFYGFFNVWFFMLLGVGILLDRFGIRFSTISSVLIMIVGGFIKYLSFKLDFPPDSFVNFGFFQMKTQIFMASMGYALFGVGVEYAGITVSKAVVKWFKGQEIALAMGMQVAIARIGSAIPLIFGAKIAKTFDVPTVILGSVLLLILGLVSFFYYNIKDKQLDGQLDKQLLTSKKSDSEENEDDEKFKISDLEVIFKNRGFWYIAFLCVLFYSTVFPFYKYGPDLMVNKFGVSEDWAGVLPGLVPFGTMILTPFFGNFYDKKGKGATIMIIGAVLLIIVHIIFLLPFITNVVFAFFNVIILGIAFSLVPSAMWPSVPKIIPEKQLGSAYAAIFWVLVINSEMKNAINITGKKMTKSDIDRYSKSTSASLVEKVISIAPQEKVSEIDTAHLRVEIYNTKIEDKENIAFVSMNGIVINQMAEIISEKKIKLNYTYTKTWIIFVSLSILAFFVALMLKREDKKKNYGLEKPNTK
ncbi:MAG: hypothetical protein B6I24_10125 [Bacteroidetes bacterium 4572_128]|nr:MAG: hypothetical protein B6I24_10125 [Bacteroidetes bacterium 4572_128]